MKLCTVMGDPIEHSLSPVIHAQFAKQTGIALEYTRSHVPAENFNTAVEAFKNNGGLGANVTVPLKELAFAYADTLTERANFAGAVNTLHFTESGVLGDNTDGVGLVSDVVDNLGVSLKDKKVLVVGAGGAARGILAPLLAEGCQITLANRTVSKAQTIADMFEEKGTVSVCGLEEATEKYDVVFNATAASLSGEALPLNPEIITANTMCYDLMYSKEPTVFMRWARAQGATKVVDGLGMLVGQAAHSFMLWHGVMPEVNPVLNYLKKQG